MALAVVDVTIWQMQVMKSGQRLRVQNSAASLAVPLAASLLGCLAVIALVALALLLVARCKRRRRSADGAVRKKAAPLPITADARAPQQVRVHHSSLESRPLTRVCLLRQPANPTGTHVCGWVSEAV